MHASGQWMRQLCVVQCWAKHFESVLYLKGVSDATNNDVILTSVSGRKINKQMKTRDRCQLTWSRLFSLIWMWICTTAYLPRHLDLCPFCQKILPSDWLERILLGSPTVARGSSPETQGWRVFLGFNILLLFHCMICLCCPRSCVMYFILVRYIIACLCWKCR